MKKKDYPIFLMAGVFSLFLLLPNCSKAEEPKAPAVAKQLLEALNESQMGIKTEVEPANMIVEPSGNRYLITFKNPALTIGESAFKDTNMFDGLEGMDISVKIGEMTYLYGPDEKYLQVVSMKDWGFEMDAAGAAGKKRGPQKMNVKVSAHRLAFKDFNARALLKAKAQNFMELAAQYIKDNPTGEITIENLKYEIGFLGEGKEYISASLEIEKAEAKQRATTGVFLSIYQKTPAVAPDFGAILEKGKPLFDFDFKCSKINLSVKKNLLELGGGSVDDYSLSCVFKPNQAGTLFDCVLVDSMKNLKLRIPGQPEIELAGRIKDVGSRFSLENLSPGFLRSYLEVSRKSMEMNAAPKDDRASQEQMMLSVMNLGNEFIRSKPVIKLEISPFKHHFGELSAEAHCRFVNSLVPEVKAVVKILNIEDIAGNVGREKLLSPQVKQGLMQVIKNVFVKDESGGGTLTFELTPSQAFLLNGNPFKM